VRVSYFGLNNQWLVTFWDVVCGHKELTFDNCSWNYQALYHLGGRKELLQRHSKETHSFGEVRRPFLGRMKNASSI
jgi:hypothetical protein